MDATRFDAITKALIAETSRRRTLGGLLGGALALLGLARQADAGPRIGTCQPRCGRCERCKKGTCRQTPHGRRCANGKCKPKPNGQRCGKCKECQRGECVEAENGTECSSDDLRRCFGGECVCIPGAAVECDNGTCIACGDPLSTNPVACRCCSPSNADCFVPNPGACCSGTCFDPGNHPTGTNGTCIGREEGATCEFDAQCRSHNCDAGECVPPID